MSKTEQTYIMVKVTRPDHRVTPQFLIDCTFQPDGVQRNLVGRIIQRFEERGFKIVGLKLATPTRELLEKRAS